MNTTNIEQSVRKYYPQKRDVIDNAGWDLIDVLLAANYFTPGQIELLVCRAIREKKVKFVERYLSLCTDDDIIEEAFASADMDIIELVETVIDYTDDDHTMAAKTGAGRSGDINIMARVIKKSPEWWDTLAYGLIKAGDVSLAVDLIEKTTDAEITRELIRLTGHTPDNHIDGDLIVVMMSIAVEANQMKPYMVLSRYIELEGGEFTPAIAGLGDIDWLKRMESKRHYESTDIIAIWKAIRYGRINVVKYLLDKNKFSKEERMRMLKRAEYAGYDNIMALFK